MLFVFCFLFFFFFQAEDGIRDYKVTGVQTCALPIYPVVRPIKQPLDRPDHGVEKSALAAEHRCHEHAEWLGERQNYSQKYEDLYPAIGCHFRSSPASARHTAGRPSTLHLQSA